MHRFTKDRCRRSQTKIMLVFQRHCKTQVVRSTKPWAQDQALTNSGQCFLKVRSFRYKAKQNSTVYTDLKSLKTSVQDLGPTILSGRRAAPTRPSPSSSNSYSTAKSSSEPVQAATTSQTGCSRRSPAQCLVPQQDTSVTRAARAQTLRATTQAPRLRSERVTPGRETQ
jgi:hypothetical protein